MAISHEYDSSTRRVIYVGTGVLGLEDFIAAIEAVYVDNGHYPLFSLWDLRQADLSGLDMEAVERLSEVSGRLWRDDERGKTAIVASRKLVYGLARMFQQTVDDQPRDIAIFEDMDSACGWLGIPS